MGVLSLAANIIIGKNKTWMYDLFATFSMCVKKETVLFQLGLFACQLDFSPDLETQGKWVSAVINHSSANERALPSARTAAGRAIFSRL